MNEVKPNATFKVVSINLAVLIAYTILVRLSAGSTQGENALGNLIMLAFLIGLHVITCLIVAIVTQPKQWLLSALAVLLIGFSSCFLAFYK